VNAQDGAIAVRTWKAPDREAALTTVRPPSPAGGDAVLQASWISRVRVARDCGRFFVEYAPFTLARNSGAEMVRIRLDSRRPIDRFDSNIGELFPATDEAGIEAIYLTDSKELRAFLLTSPIVLATQVRTLASGVQRLGLWQEEPRVAWSIAIEREAVSIFRNEELWTRFPLNIGEPVRAVTSAGAMWFAIEGDRGAILWQRAPAWNGVEPPDPDSIARETGIPAR
jgi:hypothetical protein